MSPPLNLDAFWGLFHIEENCEDKFTEALRQWRESLESGSTDVSLFMLDESLVPVF